MRLQINILLLIAYATCKQPEEVWLHNTICQNTAEAICNLFIWANEIDNMVNNLMQLYSTEDPQEPNVENM